MGKACTKGGGSPSGLFRRGFPTCAAAQGSSLTSARVSGETSLAPSVGEREFGLIINASGSLDGASACDTVSGSSGNNASHRFHSRTFGALFAGAGFGRIGANSSSHDGVGSDASMGRGVTTSHVSGDPSALPPFVLSPRSSQAFQLEKGGAANGGFGGNGRVTDGCLGSKGASQWEGLKPPHKLQLQQVEELPKTFTFYVHIIGLKCRNMDPNSSPLASACACNKNTGGADKAPTFVTINWDDYSFYNKTQAVTGSNPKWADDFRFQWHIGCLSWLRDRFLTLTVYEDDKGSGKLVGTASVDLLTVATGPLHHDLRLFNFERSSFDCGRIIFDVRMAQICQLLINPIEILVHLNDARDPTDVSGEDEPQDLLGDDHNNSHNRESSRAYHTGIGSVTGDEDDDGDDKASVGSPRRKKLDPPGRPGIGHYSGSGEADEEDGEDDDDDDDDDDETGDTVDTRSVASREDDMMITAGSDTTINGLSRESVGPSTLLNAKNAQLSKVTPRQQGEVSHGRIPGSQIGDNSNSHEVGVRGEYGIGTLGHTSSNGHLSVARNRKLAQKKIWQSNEAQRLKDNVVRRRRTKNQIGTSSTANEKKSTKSRSRGYSDDACLGDYSERDAKINGTETNERMNREESWDAKDKIVTSGGNDSGSSEKSGSEEAEPFSAHWRLGICPTGVENATEFFSTWTYRCSHAYWNTVDHSRLAGGGAKAGTGGAGSSNMSSLLPSSALDVGETKNRNSAGAGLSKQSELVDGDSSGQLAQSIGASSGPAGQSQFVDHVDHLDTYQKLANLCRRGRVVREVLYDDLPTIQLTTTIDELRQNHLHMNLYAKCLPLDGTVRFVGESWLPFFKIYDADIVDQVEKHFFDSYFREKLWLDGKSIGYIEGIIVFQNSPMVRQMYAGVHTEHGFMRISPPILGAEHKSVNFDFRNQGLVPREVTHIAELHKKLLEVLFSKAQHLPQEAVHSLGTGIGGRLAWQRRNAPSSVVDGRRSTSQGQNVILNPDDSSSHTSSAALLVHQSGLPFSSGAGDNGVEPLSTAGSRKLLTDLQGICEKLLVLLKSSEADTRRSFMYNSPVALLTGQRVLLNLGNHVLEYLEYVLWQLRGTYCSILYHVLRRGELDIGTCLPPIPEGLKDLDLAEVFLLYQLSKQINKTTSFIPTTSMGNSTFTQASGRVKNQARGGEEAETDDGCLLPTPTLPNDDTGDEEEALATAKGVKTGSNARERGGIDGSGSAFSSQNHLGGGMTNSSRVSRIATAMTDKLKLHRGQNSVSDGNITNNVLSPLSRSQQKVSCGLDDEPMSESTTQAFIDVKGVNYSPGMGSDVEASNDNSMASVCKDDPHRKTYSDGLGGGMAKLSPHLQLSKFLPPKSNWVDKKRTLSSIAFNHSTMQIDSRESKLSETLLDTHDDDATSCPLSVAAPANESSNRLLLPNLSLLSFRSQVSERFVSSGIASNRLAQLEALARQMSEEDSRELVLFHKRMKLCRQYFLLLHRMLYYALQKLCSDAIFEGQRRFISIFLCIAYFRLPVFRDELLSCILPQEDREVDVEEWRGTEYSLDAVTLTALERWRPNSDLQVILDWSAFHSSLRGYFGDAALMESLRSLKDRQSIPATWKERLSNRGAVFFSFLEHWSKHVYQMVTRKDVLRWHTLPGYATLLKALLLEMKARPVTKYPDSLLNSSGAMLANERLLSVFIKVLFLKTSVYNSAAVFSVLNYVDYWIQVLSLRGQPLPSNFDFKFLKKGLDLTLGCDICFNVSKGLWFIYKNLPVFVGEQLRSIVLDLMIGKYFIPIFLNWSWLVRKCYMWFLLYRVCEGTRKILARQSAATVAQHQNSSIVPPSPKSAGMGIHNSSPGLSSPVGGLSVGRQSAVRSLSLGIGRYGVKHRNEADIGTMATASSVAADSKSGTSAGNRSNLGGSGTSTPASASPAVLRLTQEEKIVLCGYLELSKFLVRIKAPSVFPSAAASRHIPQMLQASGLTPSEIRSLGRLYASDYNDHDLKDMSSGEGDCLRYHGPHNKNIGDSSPPRSSANHTPNASPRTAAHLSHAHHSTQHLTHHIPSQGKIVPGGSDTGSRGNENVGATDVAVDSGKATSDSSASPKREIDTDEEISEPLPSWGFVDIDSSEGRVRYDPLEAPMPPECRVYIKSAVEEFQKELSVYRNWVVNGAQPLPSMHIPSSPLDSNVDVPLDTW